MASSNKGRAAQVGGADVLDLDLVSTVDLASPLAAIVGDYYWGAGISEAPAPVEIPYAWVATPLQRQPTNVVNVSHVTGSNGVVGTFTDDASVERYGQRFHSTDIDTAVTADPANLAVFEVTYFARPRPRQPVLGLNLYARTDAECLLILSVGVTQRVRVTGAPAGWPPGAANFTVEGVRHVGAADMRVVEWATSAIVGVSDTEPGPWWRWDASLWDGTDIRAF